MTEKEQAIQHLKDCKEFICISISGDDMNIDGYFDDLADAPDTLEQAAQKIRAEIIKQRNLN